uniref:Uncharacterized protein n=2 Tax=Plectus sambesii TaxID=2011161 RepID=A0A914VI63_9BILA
MLMAENNYTYYNGNGHGMDHRPTAPAATYFVDCRQTNHGSWRLPVERAPQPTPRPPIAAYQRHLLRLELHLAIRRVMAVSGVAVAMAARDDAEVGRPSRRAKYGGRPPGASEINCQVADETSPGRRAWVTEKPIRGGADSQRPVESPGVRIGGTGHEDHPRATLCDLFLFSIALSRALSPASHLREYLPRSALMAAAAHFRGILRGVKR